MSWNEITLNYTISIPLSLLPCQAARQRASPAGRGRIFLAALAAVLDGVRVYFY